MAGSSSQDRERPSEALNMFSSVDCNASTLRNLMEMCKSEKYILKNHPIRMATFKKVLVNLLLTKFSFKFESKNINLVKKQHAMFKPDKIATKLLEKSLTINLPYKTNIVID